MKKKDVYSSHTLLYISSPKCCTFLSCVGLWSLLTHSSSLTQSQFSSHTPISSSFLLDIFICTSTQLTPVLFYTAIPITFVAQSICWQLSSSSLVCVCLHGQSLACFMQEKKKVFSVREYLKNSFSTAECFHYHKSILFCVQKFSF